MKNQIWFMTAIMGVIFCLSGCPSPNNEGSRIESNNGGKITSLQVLIDNTDSGEIDLSQYKDITEWDANINKSLTISNGSDLQGAT
ncbi:MAG: hypothetical protein J6W76_06910, partial [Spirochaetales bacterium]|nr:hypothetical protein [Spirochaetales bacterium]